MQHLDDGLIQELIDGEIPSHDLAPMQAHLASCESCRARLDTARMAATEADELLIMLDEPEPAASVGPPTVIPIRKPHWSRNVAWAASLMLAAGLGFASRDVILPPERGTITGRETSTELGTPAERDAATERGTRDTELAEPTGLEETRSASRAPRPESTAPVPSTSSASRVPRSGQPEPVATTQTPAVNPAVPAAPPPAAAVGAASGAAQEATRQSVGNLAEAVAAGESTRGRRERTLSSFDRAAPAVTSQGAFSDAAKSLVAAREVDLPAAMQTLGGSIKLIDGMVPTRLDAIGDEVRVVYRVIWGEVLLSQRRVGDRLEWDLSGPPGLPADSLAVLRGKVRP